MRLSVPSGTGQDRFGTGGQKKGNEPDAESPDFSGLCYRWRRFELNNGI